MSIEQAGHYLDLATIFLVIVLMGCLGVYIVREFIREFKGQRAGCSCPACKGIRSQ